MFALLCSYAMQFHMDPISPVDLLFSRAKGAGIFMTDICSEAGVAPSTPSRWKEKPDSATLATIRKLDEALTRIIASRKEAA
jgi:hypothetical protein